MTKDIESSFLEMLEKDDLKHRIVFCDCCGIPKVEFLKNGEVVAWSLLGDLAINLEFFREHRIRDESWALCNISGNHQHSWVGVA